MRLALTGFGHVGVFPEQGSNWNFIFDTITSWELTKPRVLNLFAYTGAASVVARAAGAEVTSRGCFPARLKLGESKHAVESIG
ncbi:MAG: hypothetical protein U5K54_23590 [Cytophagales bacterium]|nr:hypothetical protein [Cytophagales bacterium]